MSDKTLRRYKGNNYKTPSHPAKESQQGKAFFIYGTAKNLYVFQFGSLAKNYRSKIHKVQKRVAIPKI
jgi:DUF1365 family protein